MSIVGTRPPLISETNLYELHHYARLAIKPGITGLWQVSGRSDITDFEEVVRLDKEYIEKAQFDVNFFGTVNVNKAVLPIMRHQSSGHIINISSVAATAHIPFQTFYSASKAAISSYSYALANEVRPFALIFTVSFLKVAVFTFTSAPESISIIVVFKPS